MGTIKDRSGKDLVDAEEIKERWKEYMEELYKKNLMTCSLKESYRKTQYIKKQRHHFSD